MLSVPRIWKWVEQSRRSIADDFAPKTLDEFVDLWEMREQNGQRSWAVYRDGELAGVISSNQISPVVADFHVIFGREFWGSANTLPAAREVLAIIFEKYSKVTSLVFADNHAILGNLYKLHGLKEGVLKEQTLRDGKPIDMVLVAIHKETFLNGITERRVSKQQHEQHVTVKLDSGSDANEGEVAHSVSSGHPEPAVQLRVDGNVEPGVDHRADHVGDPGLSQPGL